MPEITLLSFGELSKMGRDPGVQIRTMNWQQLLQQDWKQEFFQRYDRLPITRLNQLGATIFVVLLAWLASQLTWALMPVQSATHTVTSNTNQARPATNQAQLEQVVAAHLFGDYQAKVKDKPVAQVVTTDAPKTNLNLKLTGLVASPKDPAKGAAVIQSNGVELGYSIDEQIDGSPAVLKQVLEDRVLIDVNGRVETLMLDGVEYQKLSAANAPIDDGGLQEFVPDSAESVGPEPDPRREIMAQPTKLFDYINISPRQRDGKMYGYALTPKRDPAIFNRFGLKPNDVAIEINGIRLDEMQKAYGVMAELRQASQASIKVERDGEIRDIVISLTE